MTQLKKLKTMKNLIIPCMLVFSLMTATAAQLSTSTLNSLNDTIIIEESKIPTIEFVEVVEEADEAFDFNTADYLPLGFDANMTFEEKFEIVYEINLEEADEAFDFNIADYLPLGFDANMTFEEKFEIVYEINLKEADEAFDFNTEDYLPVGFNLNENILNSIVEIEVEEEDESFDYNTKKYLPIGFDALKKAMITSEL